jgi:hypothetical protein
MHTSFMTVWVVGRNSGDDVPMLTPEHIEGLSVALNESTLLNVEVRSAQRLAEVTLRLLSLPEAGPMPDDPRVRFNLREVSRVAASLRHGAWNDTTARVEPFSIDQLPQVVESFGGLAVYGWEFFDLAHHDPSWEERLSLDWRGARAPNGHSVHLFQEGTGRHLDLSIWFRDLTCSTPVGTDLALEDVIAAGRRWWDAFHAHGPRTQGTGLVPLDNGPA